MLYQARNWNEILHKWQWNAISSFLGTRWCPFHRRPISHIWHNRKDHGTGELYINSLFLLPIMCSHNIPIPKWMLLNQNIFTMGKLTRHLRRGSQHVTSNPRESVASCYPKAFCIPLFPKKEKKISKNKEQNLLDLYTILLLFVFHLSHTVYYMLDLLW